MWLRGQSNYSASMAHKAMWCLSTQTECSFTCVVSVRPRVFQGLSGSNCTKSTKEMDMTKTFLLQMCRCCYLCNLFDSICQMRDCVVALHSPFGSFNSFSCMLLTFVHFLRSYMLLCPSFNIAVVRHIWTEPQVRLSECLPCVRILGVIHFVCIVIHLLLFEAVLHSTRINLRPSNI